MYIVYMYFKFSMYMYNCHFIDGYIIVHSCTCMMTQLNMCINVYCSFIYSSDFGKMVAREYLNFFEFADQDLVECLRQFLGSVSLSGETYDRERIMMHYSEKYFEHNPYSFPSYGRGHVTLAEITYAL